MTGIAKAMRVMIQSDFTKGGDQDETDYQEPKSLSLLRQAAIRLPSAPRFLVLQQFSSVDACARTQWAGVIALGCGGEIALGGSLGAVRAANGSNGNRQHAVNRAGLFDV